MSSLLTALFSAYAVQGVLLAAVTLAVLGLGRRLQRRYGARWFCRVWLVLAVLFLLPLRLLAPDAPAARITVPDALTIPRTAAGSVLTDEALPLAEEAADSSPSMEDDAIPPAAVDRPSPAVPLPRDAAETGRQLPPLIEVSAGLWLTGAAAVLLWQGLAWGLWYRRVLRLRRAPAPEWQTALEDAQRQVCLRRPPRLMASAGVGGPLVTGLLRPVLLVPVQAPPREQAALMLTHELTHLRRGDLRFKLVLVLAAAVHWYNPVVWLLLHRAGRDIEAACDEQAVAGKDRAFRAAYSDALLRAVRMGRAPSLTTGFALSRADWAERLRQLWDLTPKRRGRTALAGLALCAVLAGGLVSCRMPAEDSSLPAATASPEPDMPRTPESAQPSPAADLTGSETVWADLDGGAYLAPVPAPLEETTYQLRDSWQVPSLGLVGCACADGSGGLDLYTSKDEGQNWDHIHTDLSGLFGEEPFLVMNFQMVSDSTGFVVLRLGSTQEEAALWPSTYYWCSDDMAVLSTRDGGNTWELTGRHSLPAGTEQENWHLQPFLWVNEKVGFWAPHTDYTRFALWRTVDGGASWEALDLSALEDEIPYDEVPGIHTCTVKLDPAHPGRVRVGCSADHSNSMEHRFYIFSDDLGESWQMDSSTEPIFPAAAADEENSNA